MDIQSPVTNPGTRSNRACSEDATGFLLAISALPDDYPAERITKFAGELKTIKSMRLADHTYLFTITDRFAIEGRGVVVVPGIPWTQKTTVRKGDPLILRTPLAEIIRTHLQDIELIHYSPGAKRLEATSFSLPKELHKFDIPIGTEVYLDTTATDTTNSEHVVGGNGG